MKGPGLAFEYGYLVGENKMGTSGNVPASQAYPRRKLEHLTKVHRM